MKKIPLTQGKVALVDDEDYDELMKYKWCAHQTKPGRYYAKTYKEGQHISMPELLLKRPKGMEIDHINHDGLDNRRCNIRIATRAQNMMNQKCRNKHGYIGVSRICNTKSERFKAMIRFNYKRIYLGIYPTVEGAARAYDEAAKRLFGEFANLNFPEVVL